MEALRMPGCFTVGERLAEIALRRDSGQALASIVTDMGGDLSDAGDLLPGVPPPKRCFQVYAQLSHSSFAHRISTFPFSSFLLRRVALDILGVLLTRTWVTRMCSRRIIMQDYDAVSTDVFPSAVGEGGSWDHVWLDAIIGVVAGQDEKVLSCNFWC